MSVAITELNDAQREAVLHGEGPLLVLAGAGSGKTRVLTMRIARLVLEGHVSPAHIMAVTFTNKAATEMRNRLTRLLGTEPKGMWVGTFHAIGARLLRAHADRVGRTPNFTIYDEDDSLNVVKRLLESKGISPKEWTPKTIASAISDAKNGLVSAAEYERLANDPRSRVASAVYRELEGTLRAANAVTFDDLLTLPVQILIEHPDLRESYQRRFEHILVDEYQDTNRAQYVFIKTLASHGRVTVVGDDDQSIYGWRGADIRNVLEFERDFPQAHIVRLEENYRSTAPILDLANVVIAENTKRLGKTLRTSKLGGERVKVVRALDDRDEATWVCEEIVRRRSQSRDLALREIAILYRTNAQSRGFEEALRRAGMPYRLVGAMRFYDRREIRDLMSYLKLIANPSDDEAFRRAITVPRRGVGDTALAQLMAGAAQYGISLMAASARADVLEGMRPAVRNALNEFSHLLVRLRMQAAEASVDELLRTLIDAIRYGDYLRAEGPDALDRLDNVRELIASAAETVVDDGGEVGLTPLDHFLQRTTLAAAIDQLDPNADAVLMMTLHNAKGLEFPVVFVTGLEDGLFPLRSYDDEGDGIEEERRLFYVGITRAERYLYLTFAEQRRRNGELLPGKESGFLTAIPPTMVDRMETLKVRTMGRSVFGSEWAWGGGRQSQGPSDGGSMRPAVRRPGTPVTIRPVVKPTYADVADESQDVPSFRIGERVSHAKFGTGTIAELSGTGPTAKVRIDFERADVGRKTLVIAQAGLQSACD